MFAWDEFLNVCMECLSGLAALAMGLAALAAEKLWIAPQLRCSAIQADPKP